MRVTRSRGSVRKFSATIATSRTRITHEPGLPKSRRMSMRKEGVPRRLRAAEVLRPIAATSPRFDQRFDAGNACSLMRFVLRCMT